MQKNTRKSKLVKRPSYIYGALVLMVAMIAVAGAQMLPPGASQDSSATPILVDYTIYIDGTDPALTGVTWGPTALTFDSTLDTTKVYAITQTSPSALGYVITFDVGAAFDVVFDGINIQNAAGPAVVLEAATQANLYLYRDSTVDGGIFVKSGSTLVVDSSDDPGVGSFDGKLTAIGYSIAGTEGTALTGSSAAGIGGSAGAASGTIVIEGGTIDATGGRMSAGIGGGWTNNAVPTTTGTITINGGNVKATGGGGAAGIGSSGYTSNTATAPGNGMITIAGGIVDSEGSTTNTGSGRYKAGAGIGGGASTGGGTIVIEGDAVVTSRGASTTSNGGGAGIGGGGGYLVWGGIGGDITMRGDSTVTAVGGQGSAAIGGGGGFITAGVPSSGGDGGTIVIDGNASVVARALSGVAGSGIGGAYGRTGADITIGSNTSIVATAQQQASPAPQTLAIQALTLTCTGSFVQVDGGTTYGSPATGRFVVFADGDMDTALLNYSFPQPITCFAFQIPGAPAGTDYNIYYSSLAGYTEVLIRGTTNKAIYSIDSLTGYDADIPSAGDQGKAYLPLGRGTQYFNVVTELHIDTNGLPVPGLSDGAGLVKSGVYGKAMPLAVGYVPIGYSWDYMPDLTPIGGSVLGPGTFETGNPVNQSVSAVDSTIYFIYEKGLAYVDVDGVTKSTGNANVTVLDLLEVAGMATPYTLLGPNTPGDTEWYYVNEDIIFASPLTITGNVSIIIADDCTMSVTGGVFADAHMTLGIYSQPRTGTAMGAIEVDGSVVLDDGSVLRNSALIAGVNDVAVRATGAADIVNAGDIDGDSGSQDGIVFEDDGTLLNYGSITGDNAVVADGAVDIVNDALLALSTPLIGLIVAYGSDAIVHNGTGTIENHAEIRGSNNGIYITTDKVDVDNGAAGIIAGDVCIRVIGGSEINNAGTIAFELSGSILSSIGVYIAEDTTVVNTSTGRILGNVSGIDATGGTNPETTLVNYNEIVGDVTLSNGDNDVTFMKDSWIDGDFTIGSGNSTLHFAGTFLPLDPLEYATVTDTADISASTTVSFDDTGLATPLVMGDEVTLIAAGTIAGSFTADSYTTVTNTYKIVSDTATDCLLVRLGQIVTVDITGTGTVTVTGTGSTSGPFTATVSAIGANDIFVPDDISTLTFTATPPAGGVFVSFTLNSGSTDRSSPQDYSISDGDTVYAVFQPDATVNYNITVDITGAGSVSVAGTGGYGVTVTKTSTVSVPVALTSLTFDASTAGVFVSFTLNSGTADRKSPIDYTVADGDTVYAVFEASATSNYNVTVNYTGSGGGTVNVTGAGYTQSVTLTSTLSVPATTTSLTFAAVTAGTNVFVSFTLNSGTADTTSPQTYSSLVHGDVVNVEFDPNTTLFYNIDVNLTGAGSGSVTVTGLLGYSQTVIVSSKIVVPVSAGYNLTFAAAPDAGSVFVSFDLNGGTPDTASPQTYSSLAHGDAVNAEFDSGIGTYYNVEVNITGTGTVTVTSIGGTYSQSVTGTNAAYTVSVPVSEGYDLTFTASTSAPNVFFSFALGSGTPSKVSPQTYTVSHGDTVNAVFTTTSTDHAFTLDITEEGSVRVTGTGGYDQTVTSSSAALSVTLSVPNAAGTLTFSASAAAGYVFVSFTLNSGTPVGVSPQSFTVLNGNTVYAVFAPVATATVYNVTVDISPAGAGGVTVTGSGGYTMAVTSTSTLSVPLTAGYNLTFSATFAGTNTFAYFKQNSGTEDRVSPCTYTVANGDTVYAVFGTTSTDYNIIVGIAGTGAGTVTVTSPGTYSQTVSLPGTSLVSVPVSEGNDLTFTASTTGTNVFVSFTLNSGTADRSSPQTYTVAHNDTVDAVFDVDATVNYNVNIDITGSGDVTVTSPGTYSQTVSATGVNVVSVPVLEGNSLTFAAAGTGTDMFVSLANGTAPADYATPQTYTVLHNGTVYAVFGSSSGFYNITVDIAGAGTVTVSGASYSQAVTSTQTISVPVTAGYDLTFTASTAGTNVFAGFGYEDPSVPDKASPQKYTVVSGDTVYAVFNPNAGAIYNFYVDISGMGDVEVTGSGYSQTVSGAGTYTIAMPTGLTSLTFVATVTGTNVFAGFGLNNSAATDYSSPQTYTVTAGDTVYAVFGTMASHYSVTVDITGSGTVTVTSPGGTYSQTVSATGANVVSVPVSEGNSLTFAAAGTGTDAFVSLAHTGAPAGSTPQTYTVAHNDTVYAVFAASTGVYNITVDITGAGSVTVTSPGTYSQTVTATTASTVTLSVPVSEGYDLTFTAVPAGTGVFVGLGYNNALVPDKSSPQTYTVTAGDTIYAEFEPDNTLTYNITVDITGTGAVTVTSPGAYSQTVSATGANVVSVPVSEGYDLTFTASTTGTNVFVSFVLNGGAIVRASPYTYTVADGSTVFATFEPDATFTYNITVNVAGTGDVTVTDDLLGYIQNVSSTSLLSVPVSVGYNLTFEAAATAPNVFVSFALNGGATVGVSPYTYTVADGNTVFAVFQPDDTVTYNIKVDISGAGTGSVDVTGIGYSQTVSSNVILAVPATAGGTLTFEAFPTAPSTFAGFGQNSLATPVMVNPVSWNISNGDVIYVVFAASSTSVYNFYLDITGSGNVDVEGAGGYLQTVGYSAMVAVPASAGHDLTFYADTPPPNTFAGFGYEDATAPDMVSPQTYSVWDGDTVYAVFETNATVINIIVSLSGTGTGEVHVTGSGGYSETVTAATSILAVPVALTSLTFDASPTGASVFVSLALNAGVPLPSSPQPFPVSNGDTVYAVFDAAATSSYYNIAVDISGTGAGTVTVEGLGGYTYSVTASSTIAVPVSAGYDLTFTASTAGTNVFAGFGYNDATVPDMSSPQTYTVANGDTVYAAFDPNDTVNYNIDIDIAGLGTGTVTVTGLLGYTQTVSATGANVVSVPVSAGYDLTFTASAVAPSVFVGFGYNDATVPDMSSPQTYTVIPGDTVNAVFDPDATSNYNITVSITGSGTGDVTVDGTGYSQTVSVTSTVAVPVTAGYSLAFDASPTGGSVFVSLALGAGAVYVSSPQTFGVANGSTVNAVFDAAATSTNNVFVDMLGTGTGYVVVTGSGGYSVTVYVDSTLAVPVAVTSLTFAATATPPSTFAGFGYNDATTPDMSSPQTYGISNGDTVYAAFNPDATATYNITVNITGTGSVTVTGGGGYSQTVSVTSTVSVPAATAGFNLTFAASPTAPAAFAGFGHNDVTAPDMSSPQTYTVAHGDTVYAVFDTSGAINVTVDIVGTGDVTVTGVGWTQTVSSTTMFLVPATAGTTLTFEAAAVAPNTFASFALNAGAASLLSPTTYNVSNGDTVYAVFDTDVNVINIVVDISGTGTVTVTSVPPGGYSQTVTSTAMLAVPTAVGAAGLNFAAFPVAPATFIGFGHNDPATPNASTPQAYTPISNGDTVYAKFGVEDRSFYITATADGGSNISPSGKVAVMEKSNQTFVFTPAQGRAISSVLVDGRALSQAEVDLGYYTFRNVGMNHSIDVLSRDLRTNITFRIDVSDGGYVEYSLNGAPYVRYTGAFNVTEGSDISARAHANDGYEFVEWRDGNVVHPENPVYFPNVTGSINIELVFSGGDDSSIWLWVAGLLALAVLAFLIVFLLFFRGAYEVVKVASSANIIGKDKARRNSPYRFSVEDGTGTVSYRVGEDGGWKTLAPGPGGEYVIPGNEVTDKLIIEVR